MPASAVADYIIGFSHEHGGPISNLKLQKLLYYAQAWHLAIYKTPLFNEPIEAWVHGPVVPSVYKNFKEWAWQPIAKNPEPIQLPADEAAHIDEVLEVYGTKGAYELERLTHSEDPWKQARADLAPDEPSDSLISMDSMRRFYSERLNG